MGLSLHCKYLVYSKFEQGRIQDFLKGGQENLKKGSGVQPQKLQGFILLNTKIIHLHEHTYV